MNADDFTLAAPAPPAPRDPAVLDADPVFTAWPLPEPRAWTPLPAPTWWESVLAAFAAAEVLR